MLSVSWVLKVMDQRHEPRFTTNQPVIVTVLGNPDRVHAARICNASGRGLLIEMATDVPPGTPLKIEANDSILLGEAVYSRGGENLYLLGVELDQVLCGLSTLGKHLQEFGSHEQPERVFVDRIQRLKRA